jgi:protein disulfide-isomerase
MDSAAADTRYSDTDRLDALESKLRAVKALSPGRTIPPELAAFAEQRIDAVLAQTHDEHARASVVNSALNMLDVLGDDAKADAILHQQLTLSKSPYFYMPDIAELEEKRGHKQAAIEWLARGYHESQGAATRFQWGSHYVLGLVRLAPNDEARIRSAGLSVLGELSGPDRIYARTRLLLHKLDTSLRKWNEHGTHEATISALRDKLHGVCADIPAADPAQKSCTGFLAKA